MMPLGDVMGMPVWAAALGLASAAVVILPGLAVLLARRSRDASEPETAATDGPDATADMLDRRTVRRARVRLPEEDPIVAAMGIDRQPPASVTMADEPQAASRTGRRRNRLARRT